jgi:Icc protein
MPVSIQSVSRRNFLVNCSLALGALALPRGLWSALEPEGYDQLALLSDVHVSGSFFNGTMGRRLSSAVKQILSLPQRPQGVLVAGDCAHLRGKRGDYREYLERIQPIVDARLPLHVTLGNHDARDRFWDALPSDLASANAQLRRQSMIVSGRYANWFLLDSLDKTNKSPGELGREQLDWLEAELDARADKPALLMLHHDPIREGKQGALQDAPQLLAITRPRRHVKAIFFGHTHIWRTWQDPSGIHMVNLPATGYTLWMRSFIGWVSCRVYRDSALLKVHALNHREPEDGQVVHLRWRAA